MFQYPMTSIYHAFFAVNLLPFSANVFTVSKTLSPLTSLKREMCALFHLAYSSILLHCLPAFIHSCYCRKKFGSISFYFLLKSIFSSNIKYLASTLSRLSLILSMFFFKAYRIHCSMAILSVSLVESSQIEIFSNTVGGLGKLSTITIL